MDEPELHLLSFLPPFGTSDETEIVSSIRQGYRQLRKRPYTVDLSSSVLVTPIGFQGFRPRSPLVLHRDARNQSCGLLHAKQLLCYSPSEEHKVFSSHHAEKCLVCVKYVIIIAMKRCKRPYKIQAVFALHGKKIQS